MKKQLVVATLIMAICAPSWAATSGEKTQEIIDNQGRKAKVEVKKNKDGKNEAIVTPEGCTDGFSCQQVVLLDDNQAKDFKDIEIAIRKDAETKRLKAEKKSITDVAKSEKKEEKRSERRERAEESTKEYRTEIREEIAELLSAECDLEVDTSKLSREERRERARAERTDRTSPVSLTGTRWPDLELPKSSEQARCATRVIETFMDDKEDTLSESPKEDLKELRQEVVELKRELSKTKDESEKERIREEIAKKEEEFKNLKKDADAFAAKSKILDEESSKVFKAHILKPAILEAANSPELAHDSVLHRLATESPEMFKGIRQASSQALLGVYKLQAQSQIALKEAAAKTNDPALKLQLSQEALKYNTLGLRFNNSMMDQAQRVKAREEIKKNYLMAHAENPMSPKVDEIMAAQNYANDVLKDVYENYDRGAGQITTYLNTISGTPSIAGRTGTTNPTIPQILTDNRLIDLIGVGTPVSTPTSGVPSVAPTTGIMRGGTVRVGATNNGAPAANAPRVSRMSSAPRQ